MATTTRDNMLNSNNMAATPHRALRHSNISNTSNIRPKGVQMPVAIPHSNTSNNTSNIPHNKAINSTRPRLSHNHQAVVTPTFTASK